jgi:hypothetical protein
MQRTWKGGKEEHIKPIKKNEIQKETEEKIGREDVIRMGVVIQEDKKIKGLER